MMGRALRPVLLCAVAAVFVLGSVAAENFMTVNPNGVQVGPDKAMPVPSPDTKVVEVSDPVKAQVDNHFIMVSDIHLDHFYDANEEAGTLCREEESFFEEMWQRKKAKLERKIALETDELKLAAGMDAKRKKHLKKLKKKWAQMSSLPAYGKKKKKVVTHHAYENSNGCESSPCLHGRFGCDSPQALVDSTFSYMKTLPGEPDFVVVTGDWAAHYLPTKDETAVAIREVMKSLRSAFPSTKLIPVVGNNDLHPHYNVYCRDYHVAPPGKQDWYAVLLDIWKNEIPPEYEDTFLRGGYYSTNVSEKIRMIVLNTVFYSSNIEKPLPDDQLADPCGQLGWLKQQLADATSKGESVIVTSHIAPGMGRGENPTGVLWKDVYTAAYVNIMSQYKDNVIGQLYGHTHRDMWVRTRLGDTPADQEAIPVLYTSAISPVRNNLPAFKQVFYNPGTDATHPPALVDYIAHSARMPRDGTKEVKWGPRYSYQDLYKAGPLERTKMISLLTDIANGGDAWEKYFRERRGGFTVAEPTDEERLYYTCGITFMDWDSYKTCSHVDEL